MLASKTKKKQTNIDPRRPACFFQYMRASVGSGDGERALSSSAIYMPSLSLALSHFLHFRYVTSGHSTRLRGRMAKLGKNVKGKSKKTSKADKKGGVSDAEKRLQMKVQMMKDSDFRKKLWQKRRAELKASMAREREYSRTNLLKIQNQWRKVMRLAKVQSLRRDIDILAQSHERDIDRKDAVVQMLDRDLEDAEEQHQMALRSHLGACDKLISLQDTRLATLERSFKEEMSIVVKDFEQEKDEIVEKNGKAIAELQSTVSAIRGLENQRSIERRHEHERERENIKNKHLEDINVLRIALENQIEELEKQFETSHMKYLRDTDEQTQEFKTLTRTDLEQSKQIDHKIRRIERLQAARNHMLAKINQNSREYESRNREVEAEKKKIMSHCNELKGRMNMFRTEQASRLKRLTKNARRCKASLKEKRELANRILKLAEHAREYETERERVLPFEGEEEERPAGDASTLPEEVRREMNEVKAQAQRSLTRDGLSTASTDARSRRAMNNAPRAIGPDGEEVEEWNYLDVFYRKFNRVLLDKLATERERDRLLKENHDLQSILKQYLDGISVSAEVMSRENPLLVVNNRIRLNRQSPKVTRVAKSPVKIDGRHMVNTGRVATRPM